MSSTSCVRFEAKASIEPLVVGTIAMFDVISPIQRVQGRNQALHPGLSAFDVLGTSAFSEAEWDFCL